MPKQTYKITQFHGGLNSSSDPRDIAENELSDATDVMVDELGKVRLMGGASNSSMPAARANDINPGYGLFQFSHDRVGAGKSGVATVDDLTRPGSHTAWQASQTHTNVSQTSSNGNGGGIKCTIVTDGSGHTTFTIVTAGYNYAIDEEITFTDPGSTSNTAVLIVASLGLGEGVAETGDDYLVFSDPDAEGTVDIYARQDTAWGSPITGMDSQTSGLRKDVFYAVDGALRICDSDFGNDNTSQWYGYIKRTWFPDTGNSRSFDQWYQADQAIASPSASYFKGTDNSIATGATGTADFVDQTTSASVKYVLKTAIKTAFGTDAAVYKCRVWYSWYQTAFSATVTIKAGPYNPDGAGTWGSGAIEESYYEGYGATGWHTNFREIYYDIALTDSDTAQWAGAGVGTNDQWRIEITSVSGGSNGTVSTISVVYEGTTSLPAFHDGGAFTVGFLTGNNACALWDWVDTSGGSGWNDTDNTGRWKSGISFIYDENQESMITAFSSEADGVDQIINPSVGGGKGAAVRPQFLLAIADPTDNGTGDSDGTTWNKRITGCNIYVQDVSISNTDSWYQMASVDFQTGKLKVINTQREYDSQFEYTGQNYFYWLIESSELSSPPNIITHELNSGIPFGEKSITSKYKTAVVTNRSAYIGNLEVIYSAGSLQSEVKGDAMLKSVTNRFDLFPSSNIIEASVRDGDKIVKLEEYADRILQFKEGKMHLINVSQQVEFLEDTFMHKGISHPAATCKTDFGIAWVNKQGCYLYDGQRVNNLLEKGGRQIIKESDWATFTTNEPMIGYIPKKRQLVVVDDNTSTGTGKAFLYDMVTQSWVKGPAGIFTSADLTNLITDWNGDLVYAHTNDQGTVVKWDDASGASAAMVMTTKDIDFGEPAVRKKIYKVYITYRGNATNVQVHYGVDGLAPALTFNNITSGTDGSSTGSGSNAKCIPYDAGVTDWLKAELKPSASINNINSFRLKLSGDGSAARDAEFEINDISIVYRGKNVK